MKPKVFIDGKEGTTGLQIYDYLELRLDIELMLISENKRKDPHERSKFLNEADIVFLCLPDDAAKEAVSMVKNPNTKIIDASTAHRVADGWVYGLPELSINQPEVIASSKRVSNCGCHALGAILLIRPLIEKGIIDSNFPISITSITGYSGGGKNMINNYNNNKTSDMFSPRFYSTGQKHKHLPEITKYSLLSVPPIFCPIVDDYYAGIQTIIPLPGLDPKQVYNVLSKHYFNQRFISVLPFTQDDTILESARIVDSNRVEISVHGQNKRCVVTARFDNLGKGAAGTAIQNMNIMLSLPEDSGLKG
ncbi:MAG: N-acetyl-gamma-glutamyl-phosphate reductase [Erysipelotrichaceae bacterium]|nr:N-acetyl-gamma-glutamyl-phosphate reductase [Erysipelotrichaceae bacterium]